MGAFECERHDTPRKKCCQEGTYKSFFSFSSYSFSLEKEKVKNKKKKRRTEEKHSFFFLRVFHFSDKISIANRKPLLLKVYRKAIFFF